MRTAKHFLTAVSAALLIGSAAPAHAQSTSFWFWEANCIDCAQAANQETYGVTAVLELLGYTGGALNEDHFLSFSYSGSNLIDPYLVTRPREMAPLAAVAGWNHTLNAISGNLDENTLRLDFGDGLAFEQMGNGVWFTCGAKGEDYYAVPCGLPQNDDYGNSGLFSTTPPSTTVPEPSTYALMAAGLGALLVVRRRRAAA